MAETLYATSHLAGTFVNPNNALGASDGVWAGQVNDNFSVTSRWAMGNPGYALSSDLQTITVRVRKGSNSGNPTVTVRLFENGTLRATLNTSVSVTSTTGQDIVGTWTNSGYNKDDIEIEVAVTGAGGGPSARNSAQVDSITWTAEVVNPYDVTAAVVVHRNGFQGRIANAIAYNRKTDKILFTNSSDDATNNTTGLFEYDPDTGVTVGIQPMYGVEHVIPIRLTHYDVNGAVYFNDAGDRIFRLNENGTADFLWQPPYDSSLTAISSLDIVDNKIIVHWIYTPTIQVDPTDVERHTVALSLNGSQLFAFAADGIPYGEYDSTNWEFYPVANPANHEVLVYSPNQQAISTGYPPRYDHHIYNGRTGNYIRGFNPPNPTDIWVSGPIGERILSTVVGSAFQEGGVWYRKLYEVRSDGTGDLANDPPGGSPVLKYIGKINVNAFGDPNDMWITDMLMARGEIWGVANRTTGSGGVSLWKSGVPLVDPPTAPTVQCHCDLPNIPGYTVPWQEHTALSPNGTILYRLGSTGIIRMYSVPEMTLIDQFAGPTTFSTNTGSTGSSATNYLEAGVAVDAAGNVYIGKRKTEAATAETPDYQYTSEVWVWNGTSWTSLWYDSYSSNTPPTSTEVIHANGIYYDTLADQVLFATGDEANTVWKVRDAKSGGTVLRSINLAGTTIAANYGYSHFVPHPVDGGIWVTVIASGGIHRLRRYAPGWASYIEIDFDTTTLRNGQSESRVIPVGNGYVLAHGKATGSGDPNKLRLISPTGIVGDEVFCTGIPANVVYTPTLSRTISMTDMGAGNPSDFVDWTGSCVPGPSNPCTGLGTPWDIAQANSYDWFPVRDIDPPNVLSASGVHFSPDGTHMFVLFGGKYGVDHYTLSTPWDTYTRVFVEYLDLTTLGTNKNKIGLHLTPDGTKLFVLVKDYTGTFDDRVFRYDLGTAWSLSTATLIGNSGQEAFFAKTGNTYISWSGCTFSADGTKLYMTGLQYTNNIPDHRIHQFTLAGAYNLNIAASTYTYFDLDTPASGAGAGSPHLTSDGMKCFIPGADLHRFDLATPWDVTTASFVMAYSDPILEGSGDCALSEDGRDVYLTGYKYDSVTGTQSDHGVYQLTICPPSGGDCGPYVGYIGIGDAGC